MAEPSEDDVDEGLSVPEGSILSLQSFGAGLIAGVAGFLVIAVTVIDLSTGRVDPPLLVGLPAGLIGGAIVAAAVNAAGGSRPAIAQTLAGAIVAFAAGFLVIRFGAGTVVDLEGAELLGAAAIAGVLLAAIAILRR